VYGRRLTTEGYALVGFKRYADALPLLRDALSVLLAALGPVHAEVSFSRRILGQALFELARYREARTEVLASLAIQDHLFGQQHPLASMQYRLLGEIDLKLGDPAQAITAIERARALADAGGLDRLWHADLDFALARALAAARRDPGRARALAESAAAAFAADPQSDHERREIESWLARNPRPRSSPPGGFSPAHRQGARPV
jgi:tetratricopeptide (TPR) repeat protein